MTMEYLGAEALFDIPNTNRSIRGTRYKNISFILQSPDTSLMAFKFLS
jgi:hypothetical protein